MKRTITKIRIIQNHYTKLSTETLHDEFVEIRNYVSKQIEKNPSQGILTKELIRVFAIVIEILDRSSIVITDSQIAGGIALHQGSVFESSKNDDNAYSIILTAILNSLTKQGTHLVFLNESLTKKYYEKFKPLLSFLGISADSICEYTEDTEERYKAYNANILFGEMWQYCFDYIRQENIDNTSAIKREFVLIDNADILLLDKAFTTAQLEKPEGEVPRYAAIITPYLFFKQYQKMAGISCTAGNNKQDYKNLYSLDVCKLNEGKYAKRTKNLVGGTIEGKYKAIVQYMQRAVSENKFVIVDVRDVLIVNPSHKEEQVSQYKLFKEILGAWKIEHVVAKEDLSNMEKGKVLITDNLQNILLNSNNEDIIPASDLVVLVLEKYPNHNVNLYLQKNLSDVSIHFFISAKDEIISWFEEKIQRPFVEGGFEEEKAMGEVALRLIISKLKNIQSVYYKYKQGYNDMLQDQYVRLKKKRAELLNQDTYIPDNPEIDVRMNEIRERCLSVVEQVNDKEYENIVVPVSVDGKSMPVSVNIRKIIDSNGYAVLSELNHRIFEYTIRACWEEQLTKFVNLHYAYEKAIRERQRRLTNFTLLADYDSLLNEIYINAENQLVNSFIPIESAIIHC